MRCIALCCCAVVLAGCNKPKEQPPAAETPAAAPETPAAPPAPAPIALADLAGKWNMRTMPENSDSEYATGAVDACVASCTRARAVAASAKIP